MSAHTPSPWRIDPCGDIIGQSLSKNDNGLVCAMATPYRPGDAYLISAAPHLLTELKHLVALLQPLEINGSLNVPGLATLNGPRTAIAKAEGR